MWFRMTFQIIGFNIFLIILVLGVLVMLPDLRAAWPDLSTYTVGTPTILAIVLVALGSITAMLALGFCGMCIDNFVVPLMYLRNKAAWPACKEFIATMLRGRFWTFVLFWLMHGVLGLGCGAAMIAVVLMTCCTAWCVLALPYLGTVLMLPIFVFLRAYSLYFFEQFGPTFRIMVEQPRGGFEVILDPPAPQM